MNILQMVAKRKTHIPTALRWQVWIQTVGEVFKAKCATPWCSNIMKVNDFHAGHRKAEANGGTTTLDNLVAICSSCNLSMSTESYNDWCKRGTPVAQQHKQKGWKRFFACRTRVHPKVLSPL